MDLNDLIDGVLITWLFNGGDFKQMFDEVVSKVDIEPQRRERLRIEAKIAYTQLQGANLVHLRTMKDDPWRLKRELAAIFRW